jgi:hypothetical protein
MVLFLGDSFGGNPQREGEKTRQDANLNDVKGCESARPGAGIFSCTLFNGAMRQAKDDRNESGFQ